MLTPRMLAHFQHSPEQKIGWSPAALHREVLVRLSAAVVMVALVTGLLELAAAARTDPVAVTSHITLGHASR